MAGQTFAWVHVDDLAAFAADVASGGWRPRPTPRPDRSPVPARRSIVAAGPATVRDYYETVTAGARGRPGLGRRPAWTGRILADRAHGWGSTPTVDLAAALAEIDAGLRG